jgi:hypothetical protein
MLGQEALRRTEAFFISLQYSAECVRGEFWPFVKPSDARELALEEIYDGGDYPSMGMAYLWREFW